MFYVGMNLIRFPHFIILLSTLRFINIFIKKDITNFYDFIQNWSLSEIYEIVEGFNKKY